MRVFFRGGEAMTKKKLSYEELEEFTEKFIVAMWDLSLLVGVLPSKHEKDCVQGAVWDLVAEYREKIYDPEPNAADYPKGEFWPVIEKYLAKYSHFKKDEKGRFVTGIIHETSKKAQKEYWEMKK